MKPQTKITDIQSFDKLKVERPGQFSEKDEHLVWEYFLKGDDKSLIYIYRKYADVLYKYGRQFTRRNEFIKDCIQELFCDLIDRRSHLSSTTSIKAYLFASLKRKIIRDVKKEEKFQLGDEGFSFSLAEMPLSISDRLKEKDFSIIHEKLNLLSVNQREAIYLHFYEGLSYDEIAKILNIKVGSARKLTYRALDNLQKYLAPYIGAFYSWFVLFL